MRNDVIIKGDAETSAPAAISDGGEVKQWLDEYGREVVVYKDTAGAEQTPNVEFTILASAARTAVTNAAQTNTRHNGVIIFVDWTVEAVAATLTPTILMNPVVGTSKVIWTAAAGLTAVGQYVYSFKPGIIDTGSYTESLALPIPLDWTFRMAVGDASSATYSVTAVYI